MYIGEDENAFEAIFRRFVEILTEFTDWKIEWDYNTFGGEWTSLTIVFYK